MTTRTTKITPPTVDALSSIHVSASFTSMYISKLQKVAFCVVLGRILVKFDLVISLNHFKSYIRIYLFPRHRMITFIRLPARLKPIESGIPPIVCVAEKTLLLSRRMSVWRSETPICNWRVRRKMLFLYSLEADIFLDSFWKNLCKYII